MQKVRIENIIDATYDANLDTEYREALAHSLVVLGYVSDTPFNLYTGTDKQKKELEKFKNKPLTSNQISEIIHLMMYKMRNDFQYGKFKPVAQKFLDISNKTKNVNQKNKEDDRIKEKTKCNIYDATGDMLEILGLTSKKLKEKNLFEESREMIERATLSYSYADAIDIINEYVETNDRREEKEEEEEFE